MKIHHPLIRIAMVAASLLGNLPTFGQDPTFEEISVLKTEFEPWGGMVNRGDGYFYGAARYAENARGGVIYRLAPRQSAQVLHKFPVAGDDNQTNIGGSNPCCGLVLAPDGAFYGATDHGGAYANGTIYRISPDGVFSVIRDLSRSDVGGVRDLVATAAGELYGIGDGGSFGAGVLFRIGRDGVFQRVYSFPKPKHTNFGEPVEPDLAFEASDPSHLVQGADGKIYGTTAVGGPVLSIGFSRRSYGTFFRLDAPGKITVLSEFDPFQTQALSAAATADGFYVTTTQHLAHIGFDGTLTVKADFSGNKFLGETLVMPDGVYGDAFYGGANNSGFIYRFIPGGDVEILHDFSTEYRDRQRCLVAGNDGLVYGLAAFPDSHATSGSIQAASIMAASSSNGPRTFRFRLGTSPAENFIPVAKPDVAWLPVEAAKGRRKVVVDVLANDRDPDWDALTITSVSSLGFGTANLITTSSGQRVRFETTQSDPASQLVTYQLSDGKGGISEGSVAFRSPANGSFRGIATNTSRPKAPAAVLSVEISEGNLITATYAQAGRIFKGKGILDVTDTANLSLRLKGRVSKNLHIDLRRGNPRKLIARITGENAVYTARCRQLLKK